MKSIKFHSSVIIVKNIKTSLNFYQDILDQKILHNFGKNIIFQDGLSIWELSEDHVIPQKIGRDRMNNDSNRFELYFECEDIGDVQQRLDEHSVLFLHRIHEEPWGQRTIRFFDLDGHLIEVGEPLEVFILRMIKEGMTVKEVHQKSSVPVDTIKTIIKTAI